MGGVLVISERGPSSRGGLAVASTRIARQAAARGEPAHLLYLSKESSPGARGHKREPTGLTLHPLGPPSRDERRRMALTDHALELVATHELDLVHGMYGTAGGYLATLVGAIAGIASVASLRGNDLDRGLFRAADLPFLSHAVREATRVTGVSRALSSRAARVFGLPVAHITNSVDADAFRPERRDNTLAAALGIPHDAEVIGFSGELREKKGMRFLLPAFARLATERPLHLLLIGGVRADAEDALAVFRDKVGSEVFRRVHEVEYSRDPSRQSRLMALCDAFVFPSLFEGTPNAVLEAMATARPVLATAVGGHLDLIDHGVSGALLPMDALDRLPDAIEEMLDLSDAERAAMGAAARERVIVRHAPDDESTAWAALYEAARADISRT
ncbi:MAG: glycosyltransferase [Sandaracinaceae bacterium]